MVGYSASSNLMLFKKIKESLCANSSPIITVSVNLRNIHKFDLIWSYYTVVPKGRFLGPLLFPVFTAHLSYKINHYFITYTDDSTLVAMIDSPDGMSNAAMELSSGLRCISDRWLKDPNPWWSADRLQFFLSIRI